MPEMRLGDILDDYCSRCRLLTDHSAVAMVGEQVRKVRCRTCDFEHDYRQGKVAPRKGKPTAYEQVLASINPLGRPVPAEKPRRKRKTRRAAP
jgi:hypothetical protein